MIVLEPMHSCVTQCVCFVIPDSSPNYLTQPKIVFIGVALLSGFGVALRQ